MTTLDENVNRVPRVYTNEQVEEGEFLFFHLFILLHIFQCKHVLLNTVSETNDSLFIFNFDRS